MRLIMQPAIQLAPSHLLQHIGTSIIISLPLFLSVPSMFARQVLLLHCIKKVHPSILSRYTKFPEVSVCFRSNNSGKSCHKTVYYDGLLQRPYQFVIYQPYCHCILYNITRKVCFKSYSLIISPIKLQFRIRRLPYLSTLKVESVSDG